MEEARWTVTWLGRPIAWFISFQDAVAFTRVQRTPSNYVVEHS